MTYNRKLAEKGIGLIHATEGIGFTKDIDNYAGQFDCQSQDKEKSISDTSVFSNHGSGKDPEWRKLERTRTTSCSSSQRGNKPKSLLHETSIMDVRLKLPDKNDMKIKENNF